MPKLAGKIAWVTGRGQRHRRGRRVRAGRGRRHAGAHRPPPGAAGGRRPPHLRNQRRRGACAAGRPDRCRPGAERRRVHPDKLGRLDILVNNAGVNIVDRHWDKLTPEGIDTLCRATCHGRAVLRHRRAAVHARAAGRRDDPHLLDGGAVHRRVLSGPIYGTAKHGVVAMSHTINMEECVNGIRSTVFLPGEVATPILDKRPNPVGAGGARADGAVGGLRRPDPLHRLPAAACGDERGDARRHPQPQLCRQPATQTLRMLDRWQRTDAKCWCRTRWARRAWRCCWRATIIETVTYPATIAQARPAAAAGGLRRHRAVAARRIGRPKWTPRRRCRWWRASASATTRWRCRR